MGCGEKIHFSIVCTEKKNCCNFIKSNDSPLLTLKEKKDKSVCHMLFPFYPDEHGSSSLWLRQPRTSEFSALLLAILYLIIGGGEPDQIQKGTSILLFLQH